jgi:hypothetical protein
MAMFKPSSPFLNCWKQRRRVPSKLLWTSNEFHLALNLLLQRIL